MSLIFSINLVKSLTNTNHVATIFLGRREYMVTKLYCFKILNFCPYHYVQKCSWIVIGPVRSCLSILLMLSDIYTAEPLLQSKINGWWSPFHRMQSNLDAWPRNQEWGGLLCVRKWFRNGCLGSKGRWQPIYWYVLQTLNAFPSFFSWI